MGIARGPNLIKDNLVFGYDTGYGVADNETSTRFYPGETTENLIYDMGGTVTSAYPEVVYRSTATETNVIDTSAPGGKYSRFTGIDGSSNNQLYSRFSSYSIDVRGDSVNYSVYLKGSGTCHLTIYDNNSGYGISPTITLTSNWVRYNYTRTVSASATTYWVAVRGILSTTDVYIAGQQATRGTHATPYVENNRSSTESLIDLKRTTSIDVSNVSFDSNAQMTFDGTDDFIELNINLSDLVGSTPSAISFEFVAKADDLTNPIGISGDYTGPAGTGFGIKRSSSNNKLEFRVYATGGIPRSTTDIPTDSYFYGACVWDGTGSGEHRIYFNGVLETTDTSAGTTWNHGNGDLRIGDIHGGMGTPGEWQGEIPLFRVYNKALTDKEVKQNYNAYKNRFNI